MHLAQKVADDTFRVQDSNLVPGPVDEIQEFTQRGMFLKLPSFSDWQNIPRLIQDRSKIRPVELRSSSNELGILGQCPDMTKLMHPLPQTRDDI
jgi:hypothetical protein